MHCTLTFANAVLYIFNLLYIFNRVLETTVVSLNVFLLMFSRVEECASTIHKTIFLLARAGSVINIFAVGRMCLYSFVC